MRADELNFTLCMFVKEVKTSSSQSVICNTGIRRRHLSNLVHNTYNSFASSWHDNSSSKWVCLHCEITFHVSWTILNHNFKLVSSIFLTVLRVHFFLIRIRIQVRNICFKMANFFLKLGIPFKNKVLWLTSLFSTVKI